MLNKKPDIELCFQIQFPFVNHGERKCNTLIENTYKNNNLFASSNNKGDNISFIELNKETKVQVPDTKRRTSSKPCVS